MLSILLPELIGCSRCSAYGFELSGAGSFHQFDFLAESGVRFSELIGGITDFER
jgi:hypothetical protein